MKQTFLRYLPLAIALVLFIIPFFWLSSGEMDLGGDSGRLFFYDPLTYLRTHILYNIIPSGIGGDAISYFAAPYLLFLWMIRLFLSPTLLISTMNGLKLAGAFLVTFLIVREILTRERTYEMVTVTVIATLSGLFYVFSPILVHSGWDRALLSHNQIVLNPLMFYLIFRYFLTHHMPYLMFTLLLSFLLSFNFSFLSAPGFFSFFPLSMLFAALYTRWVQQRDLPTKGILIGTVVFFLLQAFHIFPHVLSLLFLGNQYTAVFSDEGKFTRGLDYFVAIAPSIKVSVSILSLAQVRDITFASLGHIIFPFTVLFGWHCLRGRRLNSSIKLAMLSTAFFLVTLFFVSANITDLGFNVYKLLFYIPGFKMFRNFYAQWSFVYVFFYALLFGQMFAVMFGRVRHLIGIMIVVATVTILSLDAIPLLSGALTRAVHFQSNKVSQIFTMDPQFENVLSVVRSLPIDGKILSLPLTGPGYQVVSGESGGAYIGPSMFSYLAGKNDFTGYDGLAPYGQQFLDVAQGKDLVRLRKLLSILNIRYIFYNSDPAILENGFPIYPYDYVQKFLPTTQKDYQLLLERLSLNRDRVQQIGNRYTIYQTDESSYLPHIYTATSRIYTTFPDLFALTSQYNKELRSAVFHIDDATSLDDRIVLEAESDSPFRVLKDNFHLHRHEPFISLQLDDIRYPLALVRERFEMWRVRKKHNRFLDFQLYFLAKRILELQRWGERMPLVGHPVPNPRLFNVFSIRRYNSWEASITRYELGMRKLIEWTEAAKLSDSLMVADKIKIREQLDQHELVLARSLGSIQRADGEIAYIDSAIRDMFLRLHAYLDLPLFDPSEMRYRLRIPKPFMGDYDVSLEYSKGGTEQVPVQIAVGNSVLPGAPIPQDGLLPVGNLRVSGSERMAVVVRLPVDNLIDTTEWTSSGVTEKSSSGSLRFRLTNIVGDASGGLTQKIPGWSPMTQYLVTFEFTTDGDDAIFRIVDKQASREQPSYLKHHIFFEKKLTSLGWSTHQSVVSTQERSREGFLQFINASRDREIRLEIRNLTVVPIDNPRVFFRRIKEANEPSGLPPTILFRKINLTKYEIKVERATAPYTLVFLEALNRNWRVVDPTAQGTSILDPLWERIGGGMSRLFGRFISFPDDTVAAEYFNGQVQEGSHRNSFFDPRVFMTWGKRTVGNANARGVNGYANAWSITPENMGNRSSYTLYIEMWPQNIFYVVLVLSFVTAAVVATATLFYLLH